MSAAVEQLEREFASWLGMPGAVAVGFGRGALALVLKGARVCGADVLVPNFICAQVPEAVRRAGGRPVFYPVGRDLVIDPQAFRLVCTKQTRAAVVPHYFGGVQPRIEELVTTCRERGVTLVEDCALALGAGRNGKLAGTFGDAAVFSFTKSDWCYGGGMVACSSPELLKGMHEIRAKTFCLARALAFCYGLLRCADYAANRPSQARIAERAGRLLEGLFASLGLLGREGSATGNFYDAGRFDSVMPVFAAGRARSILRDLPRIMQRRQRICRQLAQKSGFPLISAGASSFVLIPVAHNKAQECMRRAAASGVTLRLVWPAYQPLEEGQGSADISWLADHLLILEVHPNWMEAETTQIGIALKEFLRG